MFSEEMKALCSAMEALGMELATSALTLGEILVQPLRAGRQELAEGYAEALQRLVLIPFDAAAASHFGALRATHPSMRPPDALQVACAIAANCELFLTNDRRLAAFHTGASLRIQSLADWYEQTRRG